MNVNSFMSIMRLPNFPVEPESLKAWCAANVTGYISSISDDSSLKIVTTSEMTKDQKGAVMTYLGTLTKNGEAAKLALPHALIGAAKSTFENQVRAVIASKTFDQLSPAQKTFFMGGQLSSNDYDALPIS
jgi:hypothetical protein